MSLDKTYLPVSAGTGDAALMHITSNRSIGATVLHVDTIVGIPAKFIATSGTVAANGFIDPATATNFYGQVVGSDLQIDGFCVGNTDAGNTTGQIVVIKPNTDWANLVAQEIIGIQNTIVAKAYPIGSIYMNMAVATNPATLLGFGTWVAFAAGRMLIGIDPAQTEFDTVGETGGAKTTNTLHVQEFFHTGSNQGDWFTYSGQQIMAGDSSPAGTGRNNSNTGPGFPNINQAYYTGPGGNDSQPILNPYIVVYMWRRTA